MSIKETDHDETINTYEEEPSILTGSSEEPIEAWSSLDLMVEEQNPKKALYEQGFYGHGTGGICPKYIAVSSSSITRHPYFNYPAIKDPGIKEALLKPEKVINYPDDGQELYLAACKETGQCPIRLFYKGLLNRRIDLKYYGVNPRGMYAMAKALKFNKCVKILDLTDNILNVEAVYHIGDMLRCNQTIEELNLSGCRIGADGLKTLLTKMSSNETVEVLNLSRNEIGDAGMEHLAVAFCRGFGVKELDLRLNKISGTGAMNLADSLPAYKNITHWNLSWNNLYTQGTVIFIQELAETSAGIESIDLSWNSLEGTRLAQGIRDLLVHKTLHFMNLSNNRLQGEAISIIASVLNKAPGLRTLDLSNNPMSPDDVLTVLQKLRLRKTAVKNLYMDNIVINAACLNLLIAIKAKKPKLVVTHDRVIGDFQIVEPDIRDLIFNRFDRICKGERKSKVDFGVLCLQLKKENCNMILSKDFADKLELGGVKVDRELIDGLAEAFPGYRTKEGLMINIDLVADYVKRIWPDKNPPLSPILEMSGRSSATE